MLNNNMKSYNMNASTNDNQFVLSFGIPKVENSEEWDLSDELLWENAQANIPTSIKSLNENMQKISWRTKRNAYSFDDKTKSINGRSFKLPILEINQELKSFTKFKSTTIKKSSLFESQISLTKKSLKDDISFLLRKLISHKKKNKTSIDQIQKDQNNSDLYVTMNEIAAIENE